MREKGRGRERETERESESERERVREYLDSMSLMKRGQTLRRQSQRETGGRTREGERGRERARERARARERERLSERERGPRWQPTTEATKSDNQRPDSRGSHPARYSNCSASREPQNTGCSRTNAKKKGGGKGGVNIYCLARVGILGHSLSIHSLMFIYINMYIVTYICSHTHTHTNTHM